MSTKCKLFSSPTLYMYICLYNICDSYILDISSISSKRAWSRFNEIFNTNRVIDSCTRAWKWCNKWRDRARCLASQWRWCIRCRFIYQISKTKWPWAFYPVSWNSFINSCNIASNECNCTVIFAVRKIIPESWDLDNAIYGTELMFSTLSMIIDGRWSIIQRSLGRVLNMYEAWYRETRFFAYWCFSRVPVEFIKNFRQTFDISLIALKIYRCHL